MTLAGSVIGLGKDGKRSRNRPKKKEFVDAMVEYRKNARILEADEIKGRKGAVAPSSPIPNPSSPKRSPRLKENLRQGQDEEEEKEEEEEEEKDEDLCRSRVLFG